MLTQILFYAKYSLPFFLLRKDVPLILGLVITDRCDLSCRHCRVSNTGRPDLTMVEAREKLKEYYERGFRDLYIEGGEPFLWEDGQYTLNDIVVEAKRIGYFHVHVYTNGLHGLECEADAFWVSVDGPEQEHNLIRGNHFNEVIHNIKMSRHKKIAVIYTVNNINKKAIGRFLEFVRDEELDILGVMFYFHTPYYGVDELFIDSEERKPLVDQIIQFKKRGLPVLNSYAGLVAFRDGRWKKPTRMSYITDVDGDYVCCRYNSPETCRECGFTACTEMTEAQRLRPSAILTLMKFW